MTVNTARHDETNLCITDLFAWGIKGILLASLHRAGVAVDRHTAGGQTILDTSPGSGSSWDATLPWGQHGFDTMSDENGQRPADGWVF